MKPQGCLCCKDSQHCLIKSFYGQQTTANTLKHETVIFFKALVEQNHVAAVFYGSRYGNISGHCTGKSYHGSGICGYKAIKAKTFSEKTSKKFLRKRCRHQHASSVSIIVNLFYISRLGNMAHHYSLCSLVYKTFIDISKAVIPLFYRQRIDTGKDMLISFIYSISGEMFY